MGHKQPTTPVQADNSIFKGIANSRVKYKRTKAMDMRFYWIQYRVKQVCFNIFWKSGVTNLGEYFTKNHPTYHHQQIRQMFLHCESHTEHASAGLRYSLLVQGSKIRQNTVEKKNSKVSCIRDWDWDLGKRPLSLRAVPTNLCFKLPGQAIILPYINEVKVRMTLAVT